MELQDRVVVVTGAAVGTGRAIAHRLAQGGATVVLSDVSDGSEALRAIRDAGGRAEFVAADLTTIEGVESVVDFAAATFGRLDILVNNAGGIPYDTPGFPRVGPADWGRVLDLNLRASLLAIQLALAAGVGVVVNIGSTAGLGEEPYHTPEYGAAKAGLMRATACLGALPGVRVNCVAPDWVATDRALASLEPGATPPPVSLESLCDEVVALIEDESASGKVVELRE